MIAYSLFEIQNARQLDFSYKLLKVRERLPDDNYRAIRVQKWADEMWQRRLKCPVFPKLRGTEVYFIVQADSDVDKADLDFKDVPNVTYHVEPTDELVTIRLASATPHEMELVCSVIERQVSEALRKSDSYWRDTWTRFFRSAPENQDNVRDSVNAFRGFSFGVTPVKGQNLFLGIDVVTRYASRWSLREYRDGGLEQQLREHCDVPMAQRAALLRDNGVVKFRCFYAGETGQSIGEFWLETINQTVFDYYRHRYPNICRGLTPNDEAVYTISNKNKQSEPIPTPASRLFPIFTSEHSAFRRCSIRPQLAPRERLALLQKFLADLGNVDYMGAQLTLSRSPLVRENSHFYLPRLEFGHGKTLSVEDLKAKDSKTYPAQTWGFAKIEKLYTYQPFHAEPLPVAFLFYPDRLGRNVRDNFVKQISTEVQLQSGLNLSFKRLIPYTPDQEGRELLAHADAIVRENRRALLVCILVPEFVDNVYPLLKEICRPVFSQCLQEKNCHQVCTNRAKLRNLALGILVSSGSKPWVLADALNHDVHVGIDVQDSRAVYSYLFDQGGRSMRREIGNTGGKEAIKAKLIRDQLVRSIGEICTSNSSVQSIVFHRDGRFWPKEVEGVEEAVRTLKQLNKVSDSARYCLAEIHKTHFPARIFSVEGNRDDLAAYKNPFPGCYLILDKTRAVLATTGKPEYWDDQGKTARTLLVQIVGNDEQFEIERIAEDVFRLTQLNWNAPDIDINMPVTIRWDDELLRETILREDD